MMNEVPILQALELSHSYGTFQALAPLNLALYPGEIAVLVGPNGSGKSTLLLSLSGMLHPSTGEISVAGQPFALDEPAARRCIAFVPDVPRFYMELTAWEHLRFIALAHDAADGFERRAETLLKDFGLWHARDLFPHHFSRGMSLKLGLLFALIRPFKVLLLDEPTSALDTESAELLVQRLIELRGQGISILLSTHAASLKDGLADRVYFLKDGELSVA